MTKNYSIEISLATNADRNHIYRLRYEVYASELMQHPPNEASMLRDNLDDFNIYIVAKINGEIAGFVSITPPNKNLYSIDKYFMREEIPFMIDERTFEIRLLTVLKAFRGRPIALSLMWAAFRWIQSSGGVKIIAIGRTSVLDIYLKLGFNDTKKEVHSGKVTFNVIHAKVDELNDFIDNNYKLLFQKVRNHCDWKLAIEFFKPAQCYHGGAFFDAIGTEFDDLDRRQNIINADVLDAWFDPAPQLIHDIKSHIAWIFKTSPPTDCAGMAVGIARSRGVNPDNILPGAGSSDLIFLAFQAWLVPASRVLILDPTYGEYVHILENIIQCRVDRINLRRDHHYSVDLDELSRLAENNYDLIVLVNPNSPTGQHIPQKNLEDVIRKIPVHTRIWIDETYVEYCGKDQSMEKFAAGTFNTIICKSMSKVYALSGLRAAYLCAATFQLEKLRSISPPWSVSLPAQMAALIALKNDRYYQKCYAKTHILRDAFSAQLSTIESVEITNSMVNFVLCHLPESGPDAATVVSKCREMGLYLRDVSSMGKNFNKHTIRIAIKDKKTNQKMLQIFRKVLDA